MLKIKGLFNAVIAAALALSIPVSSLAASAPYTILNDTLLLGITTAATKTITFNKAAGSSNPQIRWNNSSSILQYSLNGSTFKQFNLGTDIDSTGGTNGQLLTSNGSGGSSWTTVGITTQNFTTSGSITAGVDHVTCDASAGDVTITATSAATKQDIKFKKTDSTTNQCIVQRAGSDTIDGETTQTMYTRYSAFSMWSDTGTDWHVY